MASSRSTLNAPDWKDVTAAAQFMASGLEGVITLSLRPAGSSKRPSMTVVAQLWREQREIGAVKPLASASVLLTMERGGALEAACLSALYELDKEMYRRTIGVSPIGA